MLIHDDDVADQVLLPGEHQVPGQHAGDAGDLLLLVHTIVGRNIGLEIKGNFAGHPVVINC